MAASCRTVLTGIRGAYAAFRCTHTYTGPTVQVRRSSDDSVLDFFADSKGTFGTVLDGEGIPLTTWLNGTAGYVVVWYDQSGQGRHAFQNMNSSQPLIDTTNKRIDFTAQSGTSYLNLPDGTVPQNVTYTVSTKHHDIKNPAGPWLSGGMSGICLGSNGFRRMNTSYRNWWWCDDADSDGYAAGNTVTFTYNGSSRDAYINGVLTSTQMSSDWNGQIGDEYIANCINWGYLDGELYFLHIFASNLNANDRIAVESGYLDSCSSGMHVLL